MCYRKIFKTETYYSPFTIIFGGTAWFTSLRSKKIISMTLLSDLVGRNFFTEAESHSVFLTLVVGIVKGSKWCIKFHHLLQMMKLNFTHNIGDSWHYCLHFFLVRWWEIYMGQTGQICKFFSRNRNIDIFGMSVDAPISSHAIHLFIYLIYKIDRIVLKFRLFTTLSGRAGLGANSADRRP